MPIPEFESKNNHLETNFIFKPECVFYAGSSPRRLAFLRYVFPETNIHHSPVDEEPETPNVLTVASYKISSLVRDTDPQKMDGKTIFISADTRTCIPNANITEYQSRGKPLTYNQVKDVFLFMSDNKSPFYFVTSAAICYIPFQNKALESLNYVLVTLDPTLIQSLITSEGFAVYVNTFINFYSTPPYSTNNLPPIDLKDLSAGISLPVLTKLGLVTSVNKVPINTLEFKKALRDAIHAVAIGIPPSFIKPFNPDIDVAFNNWAWLNEVVDKALDQNKLC